eukprot:snap_masked-scaffold_6-processed-gene-15.62-mRNA-1 protein AED:1.00 eAED:1.00 QI:0/-1/0/0/-1/1/1/0/2015
MSNEAEFEKVKIFRGWHKRTVVHLCKPVELWFRFPKGFDLNAAEHKVFLFVGGNTRNIYSSSYATGPIPLQADKDGVILLGIRVTPMVTKLKKNQCPLKADRYKFWREPFGYQWNNVAEWDNRKGKGEREFITPFDPNNYLSAHIENAWQVFKRELNLNAEKFYYWGHSAGGQLVARHVLLGDLETLTESVHSACAGNPFSYTFPTFDKRFGEEFPFILDEAAFSPEKLEKIYSDLAIKGVEFDFVLTLGSSDLEPSPPSSGVFAQGISRFARGNKYFKFISSMEFLDDMPDFENEVNFSSWEEEFKWRKVIVPGVGHESARMWQTCWNHFFNTTIPTPPYEPLFDFTFPDLIILGSLFFLINLYEIYYCLFVRKKKKSKEKFKPRFKKTSDGSKYILGPGFKFEEKYKKTKHKDLVSYLHDNSSPAILSAIQKEYAWTHQQVKDSVRDFPHRLKTLNVDVNENSRVLLLVQNGPLLGILLLSVLNHYTVVPADPLQTWKETQEILDALDIDLIIVSKPFLNRMDLDLIQSTCCVLVVDESRKLPAFYDLELLVNSTKEEIKKNVDQDKRISLILQTSGTTGRKKFVPYTLKTLVIGAQCIIKGWDLRKKDVCFNCMPFNHVGGIVRNLVAVVLSGGSVVASPGFDPEIFWNNVNAHSITWYYSGPTQSSAFLAWGKQNNFSAPRLRFIANAAGNLPKSTQEEMKEFYGETCEILPGYGMSECMPICSPPIGKSWLSKEGTSGITTGPNIAIYSETRNNFFLHEEGEILVSGVPAFNGYLNYQDEPSTVFIEKDGLEWFKTGDMGKLDEDGFLFVTGRKKEVINRGGEIISPHEVETIFNQHPKILRTMCFSARHETLQECVGLLIVLRDRVRPVTLSELQEFSREKLTYSKRPEILIFSSSLPKTRTGKVLRVGFSKKIGLKEIKASEQQKNNFWNNTFFTQKVKGQNKWTVALPCLPDLSSLAIEMLMHTSESQNAKSASASDLFLTRDNNVLQNCYLAYVGSRNGNNKHSIVDLIKIDYKDSDKESTDLESTTSSDTKLSLSHLRSKPSLIILAEPFHSIDLIIVYDENSQKVKKIQEVIASLKVSTESVSPNMILRISDIQGNPLMNSSILREYRTVKAEQQRLKTKDLKKYYSVEKKFRLIWNEILGIPRDASFNRESSFFNVGGNSFLTGSLAARVREDFGIDFSILQVYELQTFSSILLYIKTYAKSTENVPYREDTASSGPSRDGSLDCLLPLMVYIREGFMAILITLIQMFPASILYPVRRLGLFLTFIFFFSFYYRADTRTVPLVQALVATKLLSLSVFPILGIILKWLILFKYRTGSYKTYGSYYIRWYLVEQLLLICGKGAFNWFNFSRIIYYNLLGAHIAFTAKIHSTAQIGDYDLVSIGWRAEVGEEAKVRAFAPEINGEFILKRIVIHKDVVIGPKAVVAPGHEIFQGSVIPPTMSSHEITAQSKKSIPFQEYANVSEENYPGITAYVLFVLPIYALAKFVSYIPVIAVLFNMVYDDKDEFGYLYQLQDSVIYFSHPKRIAYYICVRVVEATVTPFVYFGFVVLIKRLLIGKFKPGKRGRKASLITKVRHYIMYSLLPDGSLGGILKLIGKHYDAVSFCYRLLGSKVGNRVYWPGSGFNVVEHDLLEIGDDVIFGSRSLLLNTSKSIAKKITIQNKANVADRCVILPGSVVSEFTVVGTGALVQEDVVTQPGSVILGDKVLASQAPNAIGFNENTLALDKLESYTAEEEFSTPFGRAFHLRQLKTKYYVLREWQVILFSILVTTFASATRAMVLAGTFLLSSYLNGGYEHALRNFIPLQPASDHSWIPELFYLHIALFNSLLLLVLLYDIVFTRLLVGRRKPGKYNWDESSYCQRWQINLTLQEFRRKIGFAGYGTLDFIRGTLLLNQYYRLMGAKIGKRCCLFPTGARPMLTEPDLVKLGDNVNIDSAAVVCHLNSRGEFTLDRLKIGDDCTLRNGSRLLTGSSMGKGSILMEHTLLFQGDRTSEDATLQGWPAKNFHR